MELRYRIVDVFSDRPLTGNALCVVLDECPAALRQRLAREVNLSETTFPRVTGERAYDLRIHTPTNELPFAGHPTIGTAWVLGPGTWTQTTPGATVTVSADERGAEMDQPDPSFEYLDPGPLAAAVGLAARATDGAAMATAAGNRFALLALADESDVANAVANLAAVEAITPLVAVIGRVDDRHLHVRVFAPGVGIAEDPGTGSAAGPIGVFARTVWRLGSRLEVLQGAEVLRPCRIRVTAEPGALRVAGDVAACAEGRFAIPDELVSDADTAR